MSTPAKYKTVSVPFNGGVFKVPPNCVGLSMRMKVTCPPGHEIEVNDRHWPPSFRLIHLTQDGYNPHTRAAAQRVHKTKFKFTLEELLS